LAIPFRLLAPACSQHVLGTVVEQLETWFVSEIYFMGDLPTMSLTIHRQPKAVGWCLMMLHELFSAWFSSIPDLHVVGVSVISVLV
jgi:hypothetical protein